MTVINQEPIKPEEIVFDDDTQQPDVLERFNELLWVLAIEKKYPCELWMAPGQRSPHLYVIVPELIDMEPVQREEYKKAFLKKYMPTADANMAEEGKLIAAKGKIHWRHGTIKKKLGEWKC